VGLSYPALGGGDGLATALGEAPTAVSGGLEFAQISTGGFHTCGITSAGEAWCWGMGWDGELGDGNFSSSATPVAVSGGMTFTYISAGLYHTCGIVTGGAAYCWGYGGDGQLGDNFVYGYAGTPVAVQGALTFDAISAGAYHTCGLVAGAAYCWGGNYWGELGTGSFSTSAVPVAVTGGMTFRQVDAMFGIGVTCGITDMRFVYCWGNGGNGELGDGNSGSGYYSNAPVASLLATPASAVSLGGQHVCVADSFGTLVCWGYNQSGQLGNAEDGITPGALENPPVTLHRPAGGAYHNCALTSSTGTGTPYCWGYNGSGELGNNTTSFSPTYDPVVVFGSPSVSRLMGGGGTNSHQGAGGRTSCAIQSSGGRVVCWGYNFYGQIGDGTTVNKSVPTLTTSTLAFQQVVTGLYHTCGIASATSYAYCWGYNVFGQLGNNTTTNSSSPVQVSGTLQFVQLAVGLYHTCGVTTAGVMYCWGYNFYGQLGDNTSGSGTNKLVPNAVVNILGLTYTRVIATFYSTCGLASTGAAYCWGYNYYGQLGDGTSGSGTDQNDPVAVAGGLTFTALTGGIYHVCGLSSSAAYCWGYNGYSQLGDGTTIWRNQPVAAASAQSFASITSGWYHTCGQLTGGGAIYCWGRNFEGELGRRTFEDSPVPVSTGGAIIALSPGVAITGTNGAGSRKTLQLRPRQE
jgi:alpha-tubulin suppressor-like RCC1 family protein